MNQNEHSKVKVDDSKFKLIKSHFKAHFTQSYKTIGYYLIFSFGKYLACYWVLKDRNDNCETNPLSVWLTVVGMYEFLNSLRYLAILHSMQTNSSDIFLLVASQFITQELKLDGVPTSKEDAFLNKRTQLKNLVKEKIQSIDLQRLQQDTVFSQYEIIYQSEALNKYTRVMRFYNTSVFYLVFLGGNAAYMVSENTDCDKNLQNVTFILLLFGYMFSAFLIVGFGLAILSMGLYLPVIFFFFLIRYLGEIRQKWRLKQKYQKLGIKIYTCETDSVNQCLICMLEYEAGNQVVQLRCSSRHNYHKECIQKWFTFKEQCPVCRSEI